MNWRRTLLAALMAATLAVSAATLWSTRSLAADIVAIVNDQPVTDLDLSQRIEMLRILDDLPQGGMDKKKALLDIIDDVVKTQEAKRYNMLPSSAELTDRIKRIAESQKITSAALLAKLKAKGISEQTFRAYLTASMGFSRIIQGKYQQQLKATDAEIDAKMAEIKATYGKELNKAMNDPRMRPITVYTLMEINLPVEGNDPMLLQSRAIEAAQVMQRLKSCNGLRAAAEGIFDVKKGRTFEADSAKMPPQMKAALDKGGIGRAIGPMRGKDGIQLIALCGIRKLTPPKPDFKMPTREQVQRLLVNEQYDKLEEQYLSTARDKIYIEYRDPSYAPK